MPQIFDGPCVAPPFPPSGEWQSDFERQGYLTYLDACFVSPCRPDRVAAARHLPLRLLLVVETAVPFVRVQLCTRCPSPPKATRWRCARRPAVTSWIWRSWGTADATSTGRCHVLAGPPKGEAPGNLTVVAWVRSTVRAGCRSVDSACVERSFEWGQCQGSRCFDDMKRGWMTRVLFSKCPATRTQLLHLEHRQTGTLCNCQLIDEDEFFRV